MSLELLKEAVKVNNLLGEETIQNIVENDIIVPDTKPDIARVLLLDGDIFITASDAGTDRAVVSGYIAAKILYISDDEAKSVKSIISNMPFSYTVDIPGARNNMRCRAKGTIEHMDYTLINGRKINVKAIVNISERVFEDIDKDFSSGITGAEGLQTLKDNALVNCYLGSNKVNYVIKENMELPTDKPSIAEILRNDVKIYGKDYKIADGQIIVKGDIGISTLYIGDDEERSLQYVENEVSFTQYVDLEDVREESTVNVDFELQDCKIDVAEDSDGELREISADISINIYAEGINKRNIELLTDAYCPKSKIVLDKQPVTMDELYACNKSQLVIKDSMNLDDCKPEVAEIFNVLCKHNVSDCKIEDGKVIIEGSVLNNILYLANNEDQPVFCYKKEIPFKHSVDMKGINNQMKPFCNLELEHCNYSMLSSNQAEIRTVIGVDTSVYNKNTLPVITKAAEGVLEEKKAAMPSITIYFAQNGDSLWKIAKKYNTTVDDILKLNTIPDKDQIAVGQQILIPNRI